MSLLLCLLILTPTTTHPQGAQAGKATLKAGTPVFIVFPDGVKGDSANQGQIIHARIVREVKVDDIVVIPAGAKVSASVAEVKRPQGWGQKGYVTVRVDAVEAVDGHQVPLSATQRGEGDAKTGTAVATGVITGVLCLPLALTGFLIKGDEGNIPAGSEIKAYVEGDCKISVRR